MSGSRGGHDGDACCPDVPREQLRGILDGNADPAETDRVLEHLDGCETCQRLADDLLQTTEGEAIGKSAESSRETFGLEDSDRDMLGSY